MNQEAEQSEPKRRRFYDEEFKRNAVELFEADGKISFGEFKQHLDKISPG